MWCVVRNRWFVIREFLREHAPEFRSILMTDIRDALLQADPFARRPSGHAADRRARPAASGFAAQSSSAVKAAEVRTLRQSKRVPRVRCSAQGIQAGWPRQLCSTRTL